MGENVEKVEYGEYLKLINSPEYMKLYNYYMRDTFMDVLNVSRQENPHSSFIRWLMDPEQNGGLGDLPLKKFVQAAFFSKEKLYKGTSYPLDHGKYKPKKQGTNVNILSAGAEISDIFKYGKYHIKSIVSENEIYLSKAKQRRADIVIGAEIESDECSLQYLVVVVENKINSVESEDQTDDYAKAIFDRPKRPKDPSDFDSWFPRLFDKDRANFPKPEQVGILPIFLTPYQQHEIMDALKNDSKLGRLVANNGLFCSMNYQILLDWVIEPCSKSCTDDIVRSRINEYIRCLGQAKAVVMDKGKKNIKNELVMAVSSSERDLALTLWNKHANTLVRMFENSNQYKDFEIYKSLAFIYTAQLNNPEEKEEFVSKYESDKDKTAELQQAFASVKDNCKEYEYNGKRYRMRSWTANLGKMCRDILRDFIEERQLNRQEIKGLRDKLQGMGANWLREVILFDDEREDLCNKKYNSTAKYKTADYKEFIESFFCKVGDDCKKDKQLDPLKVKWDEDENFSIKFSDNGKAEGWIYVAKFWGVNELKQLEKILARDYGYHIKYDEIF